MRDPLFEARENIRRACRHLILVEEHLREPDERCADCVDKHLEGATGAAHEALSLRDADKWQGEAAKIVKTTKAAESMLARGVDPMQIAEFIRQTRKTCMTATRSFELERARHVGMMGGALAKKVGGALGWMRRNPLKSAAAGFLAWRYFKR